MTEYIASFNPSLTYVRFDDGNEAARFAEAINDLLWDSHPWAQPFFGDLVTVEETIVKAVEG